MAEGEESPTGEVETELAEAAAPGSVTQPLEPVIEILHRIEEKVDAMAAVPAASLPVPEVERDEPPVRKPWTHRMPWGDE